MKKNVNGKEIEMTAEEIAEFQTYRDELTARETERKEKELADIEAKNNLKASAKAKLIAGEPLTEAEADTIVL
mgnify:CR=1 FL=1